MRRRRRGWTPAGRAWYQRPAGTLHFAPSVRSRKNTSSTDNCPLDRKQDWNGRGGGDLQNWNILHGGSTMLSVLSTSPPKFADVLQQRPEAQRRTPGSQRAAYPEAEEQKKRQRWTVLNLWQMWGVNAGLLQMLAKAPFYSERFQVSETCNFYRPFQLWAVGGAGEHKHIRKKDQAFL